MFANRQAAGRQLAQRLRGRPLIAPLVLAIPRGGVVVGAVLAQELGAELDVVLARKLRAPGQPELALGAVAEDGRVHLNPWAKELLDPSSDYLASERQHQLAEIARRQQLFRAVRPQASVAGRSVIVTDDGIATGSTMLAALHSVKAQKPRELLVAVPVTSPGKVEELRPWCDEVIALLTPENFWAVGQFYEDFTPVEDEQVVELLREAAAQSREAARAHV